MRAGSAVALLLASGLCLAGTTYSQDESSFDGATGQDATDGIAEKAAEAPPSPAEGLEGWVRAAKKRAAFSVA